MEVCQHFAIFLLLIKIVIINQGNSLTIDNQLVIIANDCYTRIAIGSILPTKDIASSVVAVTVTECEDECSRERNTCEIFSFGISSKGNATCLLGTRIPNADELITNTDYDVYIRQQSSPSCMPDRLYKLGSGKRNPTNYKNDKDNNNNNELGIISTLKNNDNDTTMRKPKPGRRPITTSHNKNQTPNYGIIEITNSDKPKNSIIFNPNYSGYQISEEYPNLATVGGGGGGGGAGYEHHGITNFDEDNPNAPYTYANKNPYGIAEGYAVNSGVHKVQDNSNFNIPYQHQFGNAANFFYPQEHHQIIENQGNQDQYYFHNIESAGNRYGNHDHETAPDKVCKS